MARRGRRSLGQAAGLALLCVAAACRATPSTEAPPAGTAPPTHSAPVFAASSAAAPASTPPPDVPPPPTLPRLAGDFVALKVPGFGDAVVSLPADTSAPRRIVLALHGNFDRPEWQCEVWRGIVSAHDFVLCPRGIPRRDVPKEYDRWEWGSLAKTRAELLAALGVLRERYGPYLATGPVVFTGFSLGAILGARLIQDPELNVGVAVLTEGGYQGWTLAKARALKPSLKHVLFACGQTECRNAFKYQLDPMFEKAELPATLVAEVKAGHTYDGAVAAGIQKEWQAIVASLGP